MCYDYVPNSTKTNTSTRCPIVLCLDISPSMSYNNRIENLNKAVSVLLTELEKDSKAKNCVEISVVTFSTEVYDMGEFEMPSYWKGKKFSTVEVGGTNMSQAVLTAIRKIEDRLDVLYNEGIDHYVPFLVLVTDGDPDATDNLQRQEAAIRAVNAHCVSAPLIAPLIIGVGEQVTEKSLDRYAEKFTRKAIILDGESQELDFKELFTFIGQSIKESLRGEGDLGYLYQRIQGAVRRETKRIDDIRRNRKKL